jgi:transcriptional regulator with XRE-family HTH domain
MIRETKYREIGSKLRAIREHLDKTLDVMSHEVVMSRSYISEFERGLKLPTAKYLKFLHDKYRINLNFIFCSDEEMLRPREEEKEVPLDFGIQQEYVEEMMKAMADMPHALFFMLGHFQKYKMENKQLLEQFYKQK